MFFKNAMPFRFIERFTLSNDDLEERLSRMPFAPCGKTDMTTRGFVPVVDGSPSLALVSGDLILIRYQVQTKLLPASYVKEVVEERIAEIEDRELRRVRKHERERIKEQVLFELLPRAFPRTKSVYAMIDRRRGWLVVNASSWRSAEDLTEALRECLGTLPIAPPATRHAPQAVMSGWVMGIDEAPEGLTLGEQATLEDPQTEGASVSIKKQDLGSKHILGLLKAGLRVRQVAVNYAGKVSCRLDADYAVRGLKFGDYIVRESIDTEEETAADKAVADLAVAGSLIGELLDYMVEVYGGEEADKTDQAA